MLLITLLCLPLFLLLWYGLSQSYRRESTDFEQDVLRMAEFVAGRVEHVLESSRHLLLAVGAIHQGSGEGHSDLDTLATGWPFVARFGVATPDGRVLASAGAAAFDDDPPEPALLSRALSTDRLVASTLWTEADGGRKMVSVAIRVGPAQGNPDVRVAFAMLDVSWLKHLLPHPRQASSLPLPPRDMVITVLDHAGTILGRYPDETVWIGYQVRETPFFRELSANLGGVGDVMDVDGHERFHAFGRVGGASDDIYISVGLARAVAMAPARANWRTSYMGLLAIIGLLFLAVWHGADALVVRPVAALMRAALAVREGNLAARSGLTKGPREIVRLAHTFDAMAAELQAYERRLRETTLDLALAEDRERRNVAHDLHENVGPLLATCYMRLGHVAKTPDPVAVVRGMEEVRELLNLAVRQTQSLTFTLSSPTLHTIGLNAALDQLCQDVRNEHGIRVVFRVEGAPTSLSDDWRVVLYQAARELLRNVIKHAQARSAVLESRTTDNEVMISVSDDGVGFDTDGGRNGFGKSGGFGLFNLRERFGHLGGSFTVESIPGRGTRAEAMLPREHVRETEKGS